MSEYALGLVAAIVAAIILGTYGAPSKFLKLTPNQFSLIVLIFAVFSNLSIFLLTKQSFHFELKGTLVAAAGGIFFGVALFLVFLSIKILGLGQAATIFIGLQVVVAAVAGFVFLNELSPLGSLQRIEVMTGMVLVIAGVFLISFAKM